MKGKKYVSGLVLGLLSVMLFSSLAFGGGYAIYWQGARATALGPMFTAMANDPSAVFYNPAGITQLKGTQFLGGATMIAPTATIESAGNPDTVMNDQLFAPPHLYLTKQMSDSIWLGLGVNTPFGLGVDYEWSSPIRYNVTKANITTFNINPNVAYKISDKLSIAAGLDIMYLKARSEKAVDLGIFGDMGTKLEGDSWALGYNFAVLYSPVNWASIGLSYRSGFNQDVEGDMTFNQPVAFSTATGNAFFHNTDIKTRFKLPQEFYAGVAVKPAAKFTVGAGVIWTGWSSYKDQTINYDNPVVAPNPSNPLGPPISMTATSVRKDWDDGWRIGGGVEWNATNWLDLRLGLLWDKSPIPDDTADYCIPSDDQWEFKAGFGIHQNAWNLDVTYSYVLGKDRNNIAARPEEGVLNSSIKDVSAHVVGLSFGYKF